MFRKIIYSFLFWLPAQAIADNMKLEIEDLEKQYWAPKEAELGVIQNKTFLKTKRYFVGFSTGNMINDTYTVGSISTLMGGYYFDENFGFQVSYDRAAVRNSDTTQSFVDGFGTIPNYNKHQNAISFGGIWTPFYGKMSVMEKKIVYFDLSLTGALGRTQFESQTSSGGRLESTTHFELKITENFFITKDFAVRFDITNQWSTQERIKYHIPYNADESLRSLGSEGTQNTFMQLGLTWFK